MELKYIEILKFNVAVILTFAPTKIVKIIYEIGLPLPMESEGGLFVPQPHNNTEVGCSNWSVPLDKNGNETCPL